MCTLEQRGSVFILTLTGDGEHRFNLDFISSLRSALSSIRTAAAPAGAALVTAAHGRFFSNGLDLAWASANGPDATRGRLETLTDLFRPLIADLLALPMPTIAAVTGHAAAAGVMLALAHDYIVMRGDRGVIYMSEVDLGLTLPDYFVCLLKAKITDPRALRDVAIRGTKLTAAEAKERGIIDKVCTNEAETAAEAVRIAEELAARKWKGDVYASIRFSIFNEPCKSVGLVEESDQSKHEALKSKL